MLKTLMQAVVWRLFARQLQSRTKLRENVFPIKCTILRNKTISKTTVLPKEIPLPQFNNIASRGRGRGKNRYSYDAQKNAPQVRNFLNSFVLDCRSLTETSVQHCKTSNNERLGSVVEFQASDRRSKRSCSKARVLRTKFHVTEGQNARDHITID